MEERSEDISITPQIFHSRSRNKTLRGGNYDSGERIKVVKTYPRLKMEEENRYPGTRAKETKRKRWRTSRNVGKTREATETSRLQCKGKIEISTQKNERRPILFL